MDPSAVVSFFRPPLTSVAEPPLFWAALAPEIQGPAADQCSGSGFVDPDLYNESRIRMEN